MQAAYQIPRALDTPFSPFSEEFGTESDKVHTTTAFFLSWNGEVSVQRKAQHTPIFITAGMKIFSSTSKKIKRGKHGF